MSVYLKDGLVLLDSGLVATDAACCCSPFDCCAPPDSYSYAGSVLSYTCDTCESCTSTPSSGGGVSRIDCFQFRGGFNAPGCGDTGNTPVTADLFCNFDIPFPGWWAWLHVDTRAPITFCGCSYQTGAFGPNVFLAPPGSPVGTYTIPVPVISGTGSATVTLVIS